MSHAEYSARGNDVAIIGMAGRFPGAATLDAFWRNLREGIESITVFSRDDLRAASVSRDVIDDASNVRAGGVLSDVESFDAQFFGMSPAEAELVDPQQRIFLECAWTALEDAGYGAHEAPRHIGVYGGTSMSSYLLNVLLRRPESFGSGLDLRTLIGNDKDHLTARVAYRLDLVGPAITVQTACSTSLVAVHLAAQGVLNGDCEMALAGGVSIGIPQVPVGRYIKGGILARDGHCRPFDARADGMVGGSGVGVVVLKGLAEALADGDHVHAVIKGSAVNNDGRAKVGYSAPSQHGQTRAIRSALVAAEIPPGTIGYVEAHGTATPLGDPIEIAALARAYSGVPPGSCLVGSVKSNIGHLDAAAGIAGLIKTVLCLRHEQIAPTVNFQTQNPELHLETTPFRVCSSLSAWPATSTPRRAGVSAFGIGGTNAHVVLEEAPPRPRTGVVDPRLRLLILSAKNEHSLGILTSRLADELEARPGLKLADVAFTLQRGRSAFDQRLALTCGATEEAVSALREGRWCGRGTARAEPPVIFLFPGQGAALLQVGQQLRLVHPRFAETLDECADLLRPHCGFDIRSAIAGARVGPRQEYGLADTFVAQPVIFALEYALARLWMDWGITPTAMIGHSLGEYTAACLAGVLTLEGTLRVVAERGRLMQELPAGAMLAVGLSEQAVEVWLDAEPRLEVDIAAVNGPRSCVISGAPAMVAAAQELLAARRVPVRKVMALRAFHSRSVAEVANRIGGLVARQKPNRPRQRYVSTRTGEWISESDVLSAPYWADHTTGRVRFQAGLRTLATLGDAVYLEVGPGDELTRLVKSSGIGSAALALASLSSGQFDAEERGLLNAAGNLWAHGAKLDWTSMWAGGQGRRVPLPTYPFARRHHWPRADATVAAVPPTPMPPAARDVSSWLYAPAWRCVGTSPPRATPPDDARSRWVVLHDGSALGVDLVSVLRAAGEVIEVRHGSRFSNDGPAQYTIDPARAADYVELASALNRLDRIPMRFAQLLPRSEPTFGPAPLNPSLDCASVLHLARAIALNVPPEWRDVRLTVVTEGAQAVGGELIVRLRHALAAGACLSIAKEVRHVRCGCIDVSAEPHRNLARVLARELLGPAGEPLIVLRGARTFAPILHAAPPWSGQGVPPVLREQGVYLITGGLGGVGATLAEYLARTVRARLVVISRRAGGQLSTTDQQRLAALKEAGASVLLLGADVASKSDMEQVRAAALARFGRVRGIVHAAGIPAAAMILSPQAAALEAVCRPKVEGTLVLSRVFGDTGLDFVTLCSSLVSVIGAPAQAGYAAANAFLDAVPYADLFPGAMVQTINWDTWREVGMAVEVALPAELEARRQERLRDGITVDEGARIFALALESGYPRLVVSTDDPNARSERHAAVARVAAVSAEPAAVERRREMPSRRNGRIRWLEDELCLIWSEALRLASVRPDDNLFELGADSLIALQVVGTIERRFGCELSPIICYEAPTARLLARLLANTTGDDTSPTAESEARGIRRQRGISP